MALIKTIEKMREFLPFNAGFTYADISPLIKEVEDEVIADIISADELATLQAAYDDDTLNAAQDILLEKCQRAIAYLATLKWIPFGNLQITSGGFKVNKGEHSDVASQWRVDNLEERLYQEGFNKIEILLEYLWSVDEGTFTDWDDSDEKLNHRNLIFLTAKDFTKYYNIKNSYYVFTQLKAAMQEVELMYLKPQLGDDYFDEIKSEITDADISANNEMIISLCKRAMAPLAIYEAIASMGVQINHMGIMVFENSPLQTTRVNKIAPDNRLSYALRQAKADGQKHLGNLRAYLNANAADDMYPLYYDSNLYNDPDNADSDEDDVNDVDSGLFIMG